jgi:hypothetical protein
MLNNFLVNVICIYAGHLLSWAKVNKDRKASPGAPIFNLFPFPPLVDNFEASADPSDICTEFRAFSRTLTSTRYVEICTFAFRTWIWLRKRNFVVT